MEVQGQQVPDTQQLPPLLIKTLHLALQRMEAYGEDHLVSRQSIQSAFDLAQQIMKYTQIFTISRVGNTLLFNETPLEKSYFTDRFVEDFERFNIHSITFRQNFSYEEFVELLKILVRRPGWQIEKVNIEELIQKAGIKFIEVDRIRYVASTGDTPATGDGGQILADALSRHPEILDRLLRETGQSLDVNIAKELAEILPQDMSAGEIAEGLLKLAAKRGITEIPDESLSPTDRQLMKLIEIVKSQLSETAKQEFLGELEKLSDRMTIQMDTAGEILEKEVKLTTAVTLDLVCDTIKIASQKGWTDDIQEQFRELSSKLIATKDPRVIFSLFSKLMEVFEKEGSFWVIEAFKTLIEETFTRGDEHLKSALLGKFLIEKEKFAAETSQAGFITAALVFFASLLLIEKRYSQVLKIIAEYEKKIQQDPDLSVISDAEAFFNGLATPNNLERLLNLLEADFSSTDPQLLAIVSRFDPQVMVSVIFDELGTRKPAFARTITPLLKPHMLTVFQKSEEYFQQSQRLERSNNGYIINSEQLRRTLNILLLCQLLDKERSLPILQTAAGDKDPRVRKQVFLLLLSCPPAVAQDIVETIFVEGDSEFRKELIKDMATHYDRIKDFYLREIFLHFASLRNSILQSLSEINNDFVKKFLLDIADQWTAYCDNISQTETEKFVMALAQTLSNFLDDPEMKKALKRLRNNWKNEALLRDNEFTLFSFKKDRISEYIDRLLK